MSRVAECSVTRHVPLEWPRDAIAVDPAPCAPYLTIRYCLLDFKSQFILRAALTARGCIRYCRHHNLPITSNDRHSNKLEVNARFSESSVKRAATNKITCKNDNFLLEGKEEKLAVAFSCSQKKQNALRRDRKRDLSKSAGPRGDAGDTGHMRKQRENAPLSEVRSAAEQLGPLLAPP